MNHLHWLFVSTFPWTSPNICFSVLLDGELLQPPSPTCVPSCTQGRLVPLQIRQHVLRRLHQRASRLQGRWSDCSVSPPIACDDFVLYLRTLNFSDALISFAGRADTEHDTGRFLIFQYETLGGRKSRQIVFFFICFFGDVVVLLLFFCFVSCFQFEAQCLDLKLYQLLAAHPEGNFLHASHWVNNLS